MKKIFIAFGILAAVLSLSCEKAQPEEEPTDIVTSHNCALVIVKPDGSEYTYDIHCVIRNGGTVTNSPTLTAFYDYTLFFRDDITEEPMVTVMDHKVEAFLPGGVPPFITIYGRYKLTETQKKYFFHQKRYDQTLLQRIHIQGLDESLGLGKEFSVGFIDGEYNGDNDLIDFVKVNSYVTSSYIPGNSSTPPKSGSDSDINIYIRCKSGTVISVRYINAEMHTI